MPSSRSPSPALPSPLEFEDAPFWADLRDRVLARWMAARPSGAPVAFEREVPVSVRRPGPWPDPSPEADPTEHRYRLASGETIAIVEATDRARGLRADQATHLTAVVLAADAAELRGRVVAEPGCGTALLAVLAAKAGASRVIGTDIDPRIFPLARANAERNGVAIELHEGDLLAPVPASERLEVIVANIPQKPLPTEERGDLPVAMDGGEDGMRHLGRLIDDARERLEPGGRLYLFLHSLTDPEVFAKLDDGFRLALRAWWPCTWPAERSPAFIAHVERRRGEGRAVFGRLPGAEAGRPESVEALAYLGVELEAVRV